MVERKGVIQVCCRTKERIGKCTDRVGEIKAQIKTHREDIQYKRGERRNKTQMIPRILK